MYEKHPHDVVQLKRLSHLDIKAHSSLTYNLCLFYQDGYIFIQTHDMFRYRYYHTINNLTILFSTSVEMQPCFNNRDRVLLLTKGTIWSWHYRWLTVNNSSPWKPELRRLTLRPWSFRHKHALLCARFWSKFFMSLWWSIFLINSKPPRFLASLSRSCVVYFDVWIRFSWFFVFRLRLLTKRRKWDWWERLARLCINIWPVFIFLTDFCKESTLCFDFHL